MATCVNCIHYLACSAKGGLFNEKDITKEMRCLFFKNKADVVEVVRCRSCMHCEIVIDQFDNDWYFCKKTKDNAEVKPDDFCSYGERKDA